MQKVVTSIPVSSGSDTSRKWLTAAAAVVLFLAAAPFLCVQLIKVFTKPLLHVDEGYFSLLARHFSETLRYALPWSNQVDIPFDPRIGSGPPLVTLKFATRITVRLR